MCIIPYMYKLLIHNFMILEHILHENSLTNIQSYTSLNLTFSLFICHWANRLTNYGQTEERDIQHLRNPMMLLFWSNSQPYFEAIILKSGCSIMKEQDTGIYRYWKNGFFFILYDYYQILWSLKRLEHDGIVQ